MPDEPGSARFADNVVACRYMVGSSFNAKEYAVYAKTKSPKPRQCHVDNVY